MYTYKNQQLFTLQISRVLGKIEQSVAQQEAKIKANQEDSSHQLHLLEAK